MLLILRALYKGEILPAYMNSKPSCKDGGHLYRTCPYGHGGQNEEGWKTSEHDGNRQV